LARFSYVAVPLLSLCCSRRCTVRLMCNPISYAPTVRACVHACMSPRSIISGTVYVHVTRSIPLSRTFAHYGHSSRCHLIRGAAKAAAVEACCAVVASLPSLYALGKYAPYLSVLWSFTNANYLCGNKRGNKDAPRTCLWKPMRNTTQ
jgi:hypothetical protein